MFLTRIELQGFKSFAEKTIIELPNKRKGETRPLTAVVGPNGSGKSNIADAVRWVLGEQSMKAVRGAKSQDVIFFGSQNRGRSGMAEASLVFDNSDGVMPVDRPEVKLTRRLYRDGSSEYLINNVITRLTDIYVLLAKANFGKDSYSVIAQGMIDHLLLMGGAERKTFFDEATGVRHLQIKKEQAVKKLFATYENLKQAKLLLEEITPRLRSLTRQVRRLEEKESVEKELFDLQKKYFSSLWHHLRKEENKWQNKFDELQKQLSLKNKEIEALGEKLSASREEDAGSDVLLRLQKRYQSLLEHRQSLKEKEFTWRREQIIERKPKEVNLAGFIFDFENICREYVKLIEELKKIKQIEEMPPFWQKLQENADRLKSMLQKLKGEPQKTSDTDSHLRKLRNDLDLIDKEITKIQKELGEFSLREKTKKTAFFESQKELIQKQENRRELENQINDIKIEMAKLEVRRANLEKETLDALKDKTETVKNLPPDCSPEEAQELLPQISKLARQLDWIGGIDPETVKEYDETKERTIFLQTQSQDLENSLQSLISLANDLEVSIKKQFDNAFAKINQKFDEYFKILFGGGQAKLIQMTEEKKEKEEEEESETGSAEQKHESVIDKLDSKTGAVSLEIQANPPGKKLKNIQMLSGGEKALTSIALLSSILAVNPPPFILLDEVDAALDESNSLRFAKILTELAAKTQLMVITHNRATMQAANFLYGVTMGTDGISKIISVKLEEGLELAK